MPKKTLTPHQRQDSLKRYADGEIMTAIARSYAVSHSTISRLVSASSRSEPAGLR